MKRLRLVTILATWLLMLVTMVIPVGFFYFKEGHLWGFSPMTLINIVVVSAILGFFYGSPLIVSCIISLFLKRFLSLMILLLSTIGYGILAFYALYDASVGGSCMEGIQFFGVGLTSLVFMIPVWIVVLVINSKGGKDANISHETVKDVVES
jgi:hypothetical protein